MWRERCIYDDPIEWEIAGCAAAPRAAIAPSPARVDFYAKLLRLSQKTGQGWRGSRHT